MPIIRGRGVPVPYPFYILLVGTLATLLLFVQQPELATRVATALSLTSPTEAVKAAQVVLPDQAPLDVAEEPKRKRVAIVGAGASGSAAAFFLARAARQAENRAALPPNSLLDIVVYEAEDYIGGRSTVVYPHGDKRLRPFELGASIFVDANRNLVKAAKLLGLEIAGPEFAENGVAIWDGTDFVFSTTGEKKRWSDWWDTWAALRRYGALSPVRHHLAVNELVKKFSRLYNAQWLANRGTVLSVEEFGSSMGLGSELTTRTGLDWGRNVVKAGERWVNEVMEANTRTNYCSDIDKIHALGTAVSLATGGASSIAGGNYKIFEGMLKDSGADVRLSTQVEDIESTKDGFRIVSNHSKASTDDFDEVFFAAPWHHSPVSKSLAKHFAQPIPKQEYVKLHVTMLATTQPSPNPLYFFKDPGDVIPNTILTTDAAWRDTPGAAQPEFQSISYHGETYPNSGEWVVKIFSKEKLDNDVLKDMFGADPTWVFRKIWRSFPVLHPTATFPPMQPMPGFHYLASMEPWVSTMETQTLSAREAVARVVQKWWHLGLGQCLEVPESWDMTCEK